MNKEFILELIYSFIAILVLFVLKYLNTKLKSIKKKFSKEKIIIDDSRNDFKIFDHEKEHIMCCMAKTLKHRFKMYNNNRLSFNFDGVVKVIGDKINPDKIIIFFDDVFQIKYKCFLYNYINASTEEQIGTIYKK